MRYRAKHSRPAGLAPRPRLVHVLCAALALLLGAPWPAHATEGSGGLCVVVPATV